MRTNNLVRLAVLQALACASGLILATPDTAKADPARFDIAAQPLPNALKNFAAQAKMQLLYRSDVVSHATASQVSGQLEKHAALEQMLRGTGLEAVYSSENTATIRPISAGERASSANKAVTGDKPSQSNGPPTTSIDADKNPRYLRVAQLSTSEADQGVASTSALEPAVGPEIVVVGVKQALATSQEIKKDAMTFVDSITATDIGSFPDKSASDALQRMPGITVNRLQSNDDSTHPSGEPTNILIRGLTQVRTESNGRDTFSADSGRGLNFNDISPELLGRVDAYKNQTADMIEGGIAGTVDLRMRLPFDQEGHVLMGSVQGDYGDRSNQLTPAYSVLASDSIRTDFGRFGLLLDYARSHVVTRTESVIMDKIDTYCSSGYGTTDHAIVNPDGSIPCTANPFGGKGWAYAPDGIRYSQVDYDRNRIGSTVAGQYENNSKSLLATIQYTDSSYTNKWLENASHAILDGTYYGTPAFDPRGSSLLAGSSGLVFGSNGMLQSGLLTQPHGSWRGGSLQDAIDTGSAVSGLPFVNYCTPCANNRDGLYFQNEARDFDHTEGTKEVSAHVKWDIVPRLQADFDAQYIDARVNNNDILVATGSMANYQYSLGSNGVPQVDYLPGSNVNYAPGGLTNPHNYWIPFIQGHNEKDGGRESAFAMDAKYDIDEDGWLHSLKAGVRYADRNQTVRYSTFNWTPIAANWNCNGPGFNIDNTAPAPYPACAAGHPDFKGYGAGIWGTTNFNNFYDGHVYPNGPLVFLNKGTITNMSRLLAGLSGANTNSPLGTGYTSICDRDGAVDCFIPSDIMQLEEQTKAGYVMFNFGGANTNIFGHVNVVGNVGVRVVQTQETSTGSVSYPSSTNLLALGACTPPLGTDVVLAALGACATVDKRFGDEEWYQKSHAVAVKAVDATTTTAGKTYKRMQKYLAERDVLKTFTDAGEQSETAVLNALHKSGIAKSAAVTTTPDGSATPGAPASKPHKNTVPAPLSTVPEQYAGALRWPVDAGIISSEYGERWGKLHKGIDIAADLGEPVYAIADGEVIYAGDGLKGYGNVVIVRHDRAMSSLYAHNSELKVKQGDQITQGALVALLGSTGHSTGPHVHFEIREGDAAVDPHTLLPKSKLADVVCGHGNCESLGSAPKLSAQNHGGQ